MVVAGCKQKQAMRSHETYKSRYLRMLNGEGTSSSGEDEFRLEHGGG